jgi:YidC/Oxa1 family membrane protein insertase
VPQLLGDDSHEKQMLRNQMVAMALMTVMLLVWMKFFMPPPPVQPPPSSVEEQQVVEQEEPASTGPFGVVPVRSSQDPIELPPPVLDQESFVDDVVLDNGRLRLVFTSVGARLKAAEVVPLYGNGAVEQLVPTPSPGVTDAEAYYPLGIHFTDPELRQELDRRRFELVESDSSKVVYSLSLPGLATIRKTFQLGGDSLVLDVDVEYIPESPRTFGIDDTPAYVLNWGPNVDSKDLAKGVQQAVVWHQDGAEENGHINTAKMKVDGNGKPFEQRIPNAKWIGTKSAYYVVAIRPLFEDGQGMAAGNKDQFAFGLGVPRFDAAPGVPQRNTFQVYIGPNAQSYLKTAEGWDNLPSIQRFFDWGWMNTFAMFLLKMLNWIHDNVINSYGVAIILLTLMVRVVMIPLTLKQVRAMKRMQMLAPEIEELRKKYSDEPQVLQTKMMELYRERGANPLGGCLPLLVQMPVFIALYRMLWSAYELRGSPFMWMEDLSEPDRLFQIPGMSMVPFIGSYFEYVNLLPILGAVAMVLSMKMMPQPAAAINPQQKMMMTFMPIVFSLMFYNWASGLNLYVLTSTVLGIAQTNLTRVVEKDHELPEKKEKKKKKKHKRQHFYTAAQERKRRAAKDASKDNGAKKSRANESGKSRKKRTPKKGS